MGKGSNLGRKFLREREKERREKFLRRWKMRKEDEGTREEEGGGGRPLEELGKKKYSPPPLLYISQSR